MGMLVSVEGVNQIAEDIWFAQLPVGEAARMAPPLARLGGATVIMVDEPQFDPETERLAFPFGAAKVLNLGSNERILFLATGEHGTGAATLASRKGQPAIDQPARLGFGDREFLKETEILPAELQAVARSLLERVRQLNPHGDLKRFDVRNFINQPDNFIAFKPQPRVKAIHITVRGEPRSFGESSLKPRHDLNSYSSFKVRRKADLEEALRIIGRARRWV